MSLVTDSIESVTDAGQNVNTDKTVKKMEGVQGSHVACLIL